MVRAARAVVRAIAKDIGEIIVSIDATQRVADILYAPPSSYDPVLKPLYKDGDVLTYFGSDYFISFIRDATGANRRSAS